VQLPARAVKLDAPRRELGEERLGRNISTCLNRRDSTMEMTAEEAIIALLKEAETAHGVYETNVLGGAFDEEWPAWYATYLLDHGLSDHLPHDASIDRDSLAAMLARLAADYERGAMAIPWPDAYAQRIVAGFRQRP
jgi:hypothetical protein